MSEEQKKADALADALAALAAGEHAEEAPLSGSGISAHGESDHVQLTPTQRSAPVPAPTPKAPPRPPAITAVPPAVGGGQSKLRPTVGKPVAPPTQGGAPSSTPATQPPTASARTTPGGAALAGGSSSSPGKPATP